MPVQSIAMQSLPKTVLVLDQIIGYALTGLGVDLQANILQ
jgi:hypothetical protein